MLLDRDGYSLDGFGREWKSFKYFPIGLIPPFFTAVESILLIKQASHYPIFSLRRSVRSSAIPLVTILKIGERGGGGVAGRRNVLNMSKHLMRDCGKLQENTQSQEIDRVWREVGSQGSRFHTNEPTLCDNASFLGLLNSK